MILTYDEGFKRASNPEGLNHSLNEMRLQRMKR